MTVGTFLARETAVSVLLNSAISACFCWLIFGGDRDAEIWGPGGVVFDFMPQGFMIGLMGTLVPTLLTRRAQLAGAFGARVASSSTSTREVGRSLGAAALAAGVSVAVAAAAFTAAGAEALSFAATLEIKVCAGALLALLVTPCAIRSALS